MTSKERHQRRFKDTEEKIKKRVHPKSILSELFLSTFSLTEAMP